MFSVLDLNYSFHQCSLNPCCRMYNAFSTPWSHFEFTHISMDSNLIVLHVHRAFFRIGSANRDFLKKKGVQFVWGQEKESAFSVLKLKLSSPPVLHFLQFSRQFVMFPPTEAASYSGSLITLTPVDSRCPLLNSNQHLDRDESASHNTAVELSKLIDPGPWGELGFFGSRNLVLAHRPYPLEDVCRKLQHVEEGNKGEDEGRKMEEMPKSARRL
ncbi:hypothetical protein PR048_025619 [Dryococelus australis]|uniref:Uncharacterized protein n=1 Tax=Dryococelus australis TaxID=614101 RepID=A0ABQ9GRW6_9NEOP|nr:hypothetical protein PR048_025619 [Dryococelus australis]